MTRHIGPICDNCLNVTVLNGHSILLMDLDSLKVLVILCPQKNAIQRGFIFHRWNK